MPSSPEHAAAPADATRAGRFVVVVPVKPPALGKSRLRGLDDERRRELAAAFALDTAEACLAAERVAAVLVVTDDAWFAADLRTVGCATIPDGVSGDLNATLRQAAAEATRRWPGSGVVAICADLPALRAGDLDAALGSLVPGGPWIVSDADGDGTTLYAAPAAEFAPCFGPGSRAAHLAAGALEVTLPVPSLRRDVDDLAGLAEALALGVGARTLALATRWGLDSSGTA